MPASGIARALRIALFEPVVVLALDKRSASSALSPHPTARIPTNPGIAPRIASKNNRSRAG